MCFCLFACTCSLPTNGGRQTEWRYYGWLTRWHRLFYIRPSLIRHFLLLIFTSPKSPLSLPSIRPVGTISSAKFTRDNWLSPIFPLWLHVKSLQEDVLLRPWKSSLLPECGFHLGSFKSFGILTKTNSHRDHRHLFHRVYPSFISSPVTKDSTQPSLFSRPIRTIRWSGDVKST